MKNTALALGLATAASLVAFLPATANAATVSRQAKDLLNADTTASNYGTLFEGTKSSFESQAADYSLDFEDWFAINSFVNNERAAYGTNGAKLDDLVELDIDLLTWEAGAEDVEVFFINEGAGYRNKFGYSTNAPTGAGNQALVDFWNNDENFETVWGDVSSKNSILANGNGPLALGEGYKIGDVDAGEAVNFYLRNPHTKVFDSLSAADTSNGDGLQHVTTYQYGDYLVLAYEDIYGGGDKDYNDVVVAVRGLVDTQDTASVPEPASAIALLGLGAIGLVTKRQRR
ncbi:MAG: DUF4114 domain-containing protein [Cyanobacteria bacterium J06626_4]